jgi:hypothetical protein
MKRRISRYALLWNPNTRSGRISIEVEGTPTPIEVPVGNAAEFSALAALLNEPVVWLLPTGDMVSDLRPTGGA